MKVRWLGWAGVELEHDGATIVVDPLADAAATFAGFGAAADGVELPEVVPRRRRARVAGLVTHLHRDHADAGALAAALAPGAASTTRRPPSTATSRSPRPSTSSARPSWRAARCRLGVGRGRPVHLHRAAGRRRPRRPAGLLARRGRRQRVLHLGDTVFHGAWWQMARRAGPFDVVFAPVNGAVVDFPHQQPPSPLPAAMEPEQAALAGELLGAGDVVPIHYGGYEFEPHYRPVADARERFELRRAGAALPRGAARRRRDGLRESARWRSG